MGCPIRSEIWACVAPGVPRLACRYAYEDAITDHAGGEAIYGELFNTAIESAAFIVTDPNELLDIGRSYVKHGTKTALAIDAARKAHQEGVDWKTARRRVLQATPHYNSQYSPINMGFQTIGLLYGKDFADALCIAVNCGYDTDCTGATVGSILGILMGYKNLPRKWVDPLGDSIATNEDWGGIRHCSDGKNPIPKTAHELTVRTIAMAKRIMGGVSISKDDLYADDSIFDMWKRSATRVWHDLGNLRAGIDMEHPVAFADRPKTISTTLENYSPDELTVRASVLVPGDWPTAPRPRMVKVPANGQTTVDWEITVPAASELENRNQLLLSAVIDQRPMPMAAPIPLVGARRMRISGPFVVPGATEHTAVHAMQFDPEKTSGDRLTAGGRAGQWKLHETLGNDLELQKLVPPFGAIYAQIFLQTDRDRHVWIGRRPPAHTSSGSTEKS